MKYKFEKKDKRLNEVILKVLTELNIRISKINLHKLITLSVIVVTLISITFLYSNITRAEDILSEMHQGAPRYRDVNIKIDDKIVKGDVSATLDRKSGRTLIPLRMVSESLGYKVSWDDSQRTAYVEKDDRLYAFEIGTSVMKIYDKNKLLLNEVAMDVQAETLNGRTLIPLRVFMEMSGEEVSWDGKTSTVTIKTGKGETIIVDTNKSNEGIIINFNKTDRKVSKENVKVVNGKYYINMNGIKEIFSDATPEEIGGDTIFRTDSYYVSVVPGFSMLIYLEEGKGTKIEDIDVIDGFASVSDLFSKKFSTEQIGNKFIIDTDDYIAKQSAYTKKEEKRRQEDDIFFKEKEEKDRAKKEYEDKAHKDIVDNIFSGWSNKSGIIYVGHTPAETLQEAIRKTGVQYVVDDLEVPGGGICVHNSGLKIGGTFGVWYPYTSVDWGFKKGLYVFKVPDSAIPVDPKGDLRYGWWDPNFDVEFVEHVNTIRRLQTKYYGAVDPKNPLTKNPREEVIIDISLMDRFRDRHAKHFMKLGPDPIHGVKLGSIDLDGMHVDGAFESVALGTFDPKAIGGTTPFIWRSGNGMLLMGDPLESLYNSSSHQMSLTTAVSKRGTSVTFFRPDLSYKSVYTSR